MITQAVATLSLVLAEAGPGDAPEDNPEWGKAAPVGLFVLLVFVVVCFFLFRSMNRHIKKVPGSFGGTPATTEEDHLGEAEVELPTEQDDETVEPAEQTPPRLGTPEQLLDEQRSKQQERVRKARERAKRDAR